MAQLHARVNAGWNAAGWTNQSTKTRKTAERGAEWNQEFNGMSTAPG